MKKILFVGSFFSRKVGSVGPIEKVMYRLQNEFIITSVSKYKNKIIRLLDIIGKSFFVKYNLIHIDVYSNLGFYWAFCAAYVAFVRRKKIILSFHGGGLVVFHKPNVSIVNNLFKKANVILTPSNFIKKYFENLGYVVDYLPNSVDFTLFSYKENHVRNHSLLWVRSFAPTSNPSLAVFTLLEVRKYYPNATLTMVGPDQGNLSEIKELILRLGLTECIFIVGKVSNKDLPEYYYSHQVYLNTTSYESFGIALMEAACCGIPFVSTSVGEIPYLWEDSKNCLLISDFSPFTMSKAICEYFRDEQKSLEYAREAQKKSQCYSWEKIKTYWIDVLNR